MPKTSMVYHFEQAASLDELRRRSEIRIAEGWIPSGEPRHFEVRINADLVRTRFSQTFFKNVTLADPELTRAPWPTPGVE